MPSYNKITDSRFHFYRDFIICTNDLQRKLNITRFAFQGQGSQILRGVDSVLREGFYGHGTDNRRFRVLYFPAILPRRSLYLRGKHTRRRVCYELTRKEHVQISRAPH